MTSPSGLAANAIKEMYGHACADFDPECKTCQVWAWFRSACASISEKEPE